MLSRMFRGITALITGKTAPINIGSSEMKVPFEETSTLMNVTARMPAFQSPVIRATFSGSVAPMRQVVAVTKISRFRRSQEEIELGLTREQAEARRAQQAPLYSKGPKAWPKPHTVVVKEDGAIISTPIVSSTLGRSIASPEKPAKRFRRTPAEIEAGLTIEQARAQRQGVMTATHGIPAGTGRIGSFVKPTVYVERPAAPLRGTADLITTIDPKLQARATVMTRMRRGNTKGVITKEMLDAAMEFTGKVTKCPPCTDSDGYNHLTGEQA